MAEDKGKEEEKFDFTPEGEGYISLDEAILSARRLVRQDEQRYLSRTGWEEIVWSISESEHREVTYRVVLEFRRPYRGLTEGEGGLEEFLFDHNGELQDRQVIFWPDNSSGPTVTQSDLNFEPMPDDASYDEATQISISAELYPEAEAHNRAGESYYEDGQYELAIAEYDKAIRIEPKYCLPYANRGAAHYFLEQYEHALKDYDKAIELAPLEKNAADGYHLRGAVFLKLGQYQQAIPEYDKAIQLNPDHAMAYNHRGHSYRELGQYAKADADEAKGYSILGLEPPNGELQGRQFLLWPDNSSGPTVTEPAPDSNPKENSDSHLNSALSFLENEQYESARRQFNMAIRLNPDNANAFYNRGVLHSKLKQYQAAISDFTKVIRIDPDNANAFYIRGMSYWDAGEYQTALSDFTMAIELDADTALTYRCRADVYRSLGQTADADADDAKAQAIEDSPRNR